jgi:hypothetical protein
MKTRTAVRIALVLVIGCVSLVATHPAYAGGRGTHSQFDIDVTGVFTLPVGDPDNPCNIPLTMTQDGVIRVNLWLDASGRLTHEIDIYGTFKRWISGTNGNTINVQLYGPAIYSAVWTENTVLFTVTGLGATQIFTIPGYGRVHGGGQNGASTFLFDTSDPDNWVFLEEHVIRSAGNVNWGGWDIICGYLGGGLQ